MKGFTLIEILVSVLILGLLFAGVYGVLSVGNKIFMEDINLVELQQQVRLAIDAMVREIRQSKSSEIHIVDRNTKIIFSVPPAVYGDPWVGPISYYRDVNDANNDGIINQIIREYPQGTRKIVANDITALNFSMTVTEYEVEHKHKHKHKHEHHLIKNAIVEIKLAAKKTVQRKELCFPVPCQSPQKTFNEIVNLRNENK